MIMHTIPVGGRNYTKHVSIGRINCCEWQYDTQKKAAQHLGSFAHIECQTRRFCRDKLQHRYVEKSLLLRCKFVVFAKKYSGRALVSDLINLSKDSRSYVKPSSLASRCATHDHQRHGWF